jgi:hypothetical protein
MHSRFFKYAPIFCALAMLCSPIAAQAIDELPFLTTEELRCQLLEKNAANQYVNNVFAIRHDCFLEQMKGTIPLANDCRASVDSGTGDPATDERLRNAQAKILADITSACLATNLEILGFPATCEDADGPPFTAFDLETCVRDTSDKVIDELIEIEQPRLLSVYPNPERNCQADISQKASKLFINEFDARSNCAYKQLNRTIDLTVDCRAEASRLAPNTGHGSTDSSIVSAHNKVLRDLANACGGISLDLLGFPNQCPVEDTGDFTLASLIECLFDSHHARLSEVLDTILPLTKNCGNTFIDDFESCDDGDDIGGLGDICSAYCIANTLCGGPMGFERVTITDALFILRTAVELETCDPALCDVDSNGVINTTDVLRVLAFVIGLPVELNCPEAVIPGTIR